MFTVSTIAMPDGEQGKILFDAQTAMPLFYPLRYYIDWLGNKSTSTQEASLQAVKYFYEYWLTKHKVTFCYSFHESDHNPAIAIDELDNFFLYLVNGHSYMPNLLALNPTPSSNTYTHAERVRAVIRFIKYLISKYVTAYYCNDEPKELKRHADRLLRILKAKTEEFSSLSKHKKTDQGDTHQGFKSLTPEMIAAVYSIVVPSSSRKKNNINPFTAGAIQFRNYLIFRFLFNYGLRVGELMLLELGSIKPNIRGDKYSLVVTNSSDDSVDPRSRKPSIKTANSHRVFEIEQRDYDFLKLYLSKLRPKVDHDFIFTTLKNPFPPLSYQAIYLLFSKIDDVLTTKFPSFKDPNNSDSISQLSPHITRHTWAYLTLERIYIKNYESMFKSASMSKVDFSYNGIMEDSKSELRELAGWSHSSHMPSLYAKRFIYEKANQTNKERFSIIHDIDEFDKNLEENFNEI